MWQKSIMPLLMKIYIKCYTPIHYKTCTFSFLEYTKHVLNEKY
jgi:hypothetical protein